MFIFEKPEYLEGQDNYQVYPSDFKGDAIDIPMWCEQGHKFLIRFGFHKGQVHVFSFDRLAQLKGI